MLVDRAHKVLIDLPHQRHLDDLHGLLIRDALPVFEVHRNIEALEHGVDVWAATMHDDGICAHELEHDDVVDDGIAKLACHHGRSTVFDNNGLACNVFDPRQGVEQDARTYRIGQCVDIVYVEF